jgi:hypothetical protein
LTARAIPLETINLALQKICERNTYLQLDKNVKESFHSLCTSSAGKVFANKIRFWLAICLISAMLPDDSKANLQRLINRFSAALRSHVREREEINLDSQNMVKIACPTLDPEAANGEISKLLR